MQPEDLLQEADLHMLQDTSLDCLLSEEEPSIYGWFTTTSANDQHLDPTRNCQGPATDPAQGPSQGGQPLRTSASKQLDGCSGPLSMEMSSVDTNQAHLYSQPPSSTTHAATGLDAFQIPSWRDPMPDIPVMKICIRKCAEELHNEAQSARELSTSPTDTRHMLGSQGSGATAPSHTRSCSAPATLSGDKDREELPVVRPTIQSGGRGQGQAEPAARGGRRTLRTAEERKQHRMAKNRASAAASRRRKLDVKVDLLSQQKALEQDNARLQALLRDKDQELAAMREHLALRNASAPAELDAAMLLDFDDIASLH